nr:hypothetical protein [Tanacetum cinerariifolium]
MSFRKRPDSDVVCYTKPLDSLKRWNDHFFWVNSFAFLASFPWHTGKNVSRDPFPKLTEFKADDYTVLVAHPAPFRKFSEPFLCLMEMSRNYTLDEDTYPTFLHDDGRVADHTKVKVEERECAEEEARLLDSTVGRVVSLLPVALVRVESELEASIERLFDEGGSADQGDSATGGGQETETEIVKRQAATDASGSSHPPKKLRSDYRTSSGVVNADKSPSSLKELLASSILNVESGFMIVATLPFVTFSISAIPEHESGVPDDSVTRPNLRTIGATERFVITSDSFYHSSTNASRAEGDSIIMSVVVPPVMIEVVITTHVASIPSASAPKPSTKVITLVHASMFHDSDSTGMVRPDATGSSHVLEKELSMRMRTEYCLSERKRLESEFEKQAGLLKAKDDEVEVVGKERKLTDFNSLITSVKSQNDILADRTSSSGLQEKVTMYENCMEQLERFQDDRMKVVNDKFYQLYDFVEMALHLEERFYPHLLTTISCRRWLLAQGMELAIVKCLNSPEYLFILRAAISKAIEKGMQDGLSAEITHSKEVRILTNVAAHNPSAEADYIFALQKLQNINFSLFAELKSNKDASVETVMDILRLEEPLANKLRLNELQPTVDQLMVPIHYSSDKVVISATALSFALNVSRIRVQKIRKNITNQRSVLRDVFVPLAEPFSTAALTGTKGTSGIMSAAANTTTALSTTLASACTVLPITIEDYEVMSTDGPEDAQGSGQGEVASFTNTCFRNFIWSFPLRSELASILRMACFIASVDEVGMPISTGITASVAYVSKNGVSPLLDLIIVCLLNTVFLSGALFLGNSKWPSLGSGLSDMLRVCLGPSPFLRSLLLLGVPDSECCDVSSNLRRAFTALSLSCCTFSWFVWLVFDTYSCLMRICYDLFLLSFLILADSCSEDCFLSENKIDLLAVGNKIDLAFCLLLSPVAAVDLSWFRMFDHLMQIYVMQRVLQFSRGHYLVIRLEFAFHARYC